MVSDDWIASRSVDRSTEDVLPLPDLSEFLSCRRVSAALPDEEPLDDELLPVPLRAL